MNKILKSDTGLYLQLNENKGCLGVYLTGDINSATQLPVEHAQLLSKYLKVTLVDVPPKWGIFYDKFVKTGFTEKQQLIYYPLSNFNHCEDLKDVVISFLAVEDLTENVKPIVFTNYNDAVVYASITARLLNANVESIYIEKI